MTLQVGATAPDFTLADQNGEQHTLSLYQGKWVLIYFYPRDDTPGCTKEACGFRDTFPDFQRLDMPIFGISTDSVKSHGKFVAKYDLPFTLLADEDKEVVNLYGVWGPKKFRGKEYEGTNRMSFLIDPEGKIAKIYEKVKPAEHPEEVLNDVQKLTGSIS
jgi:peroxiredoxin Q/BCP